LFSFQKKTVGGDGKPKGGPLCLLLCKTKGLPRLFYFGAGSGFNGRAVFVAPRGGPEKWANETMGFEGGGGGEDFWAVWGTGREGDTPTTWINRMAVVERLDRGRGVRKQKLASGAFGGLGKSSDGGFFVGGDRRGEFGVKKLSGLAIRETTGFLAGGHAGAYSAGRVLLTEKGGGGGPTPHFRSGFGMSGGGPGGNLGGQPKGRKHSTTEGWGGGRKGGLSAHGGFQNRAQTKRAYGLGLGKKSGGNRGRGELGTDEGEQGRGGRCPGGELKKGRSLGGAGGGLWGTLKGAGGLEPGRKAPKNARLTVVRHFLRDKGGGANGARGGSMGPSFVGDGGAALLWAGFLNKGRAGFGSQGQKKNKTRFGFLAPPQKRLWGERFFQKRPAMPREKNGRGGQDFFLRTAPKRVWRLFAAGQFRKTKKTPPILCRGDPVLQKRIEHKFQTRS